MDNTKFKVSVIYYHPTFGDNAVYFHSVKEAIEFTANWMNSQREFLLFNNSPLEAVESITMVIN